VSAAVEPAESTFDDPALGQYGKALGGVRSSAARPGLLGSGPRRSSRRARPRRTGAHDWAEPWRCGS
jgi:hypothetical protein